MKKSIIILLSVLAMAFTFSGCGESEGSVSNVSNVSSDIGSDISIDQDKELVIVANGDTADTIAKTPYNLSLALGTPPGVPE